MRARNAPLSPSPVYDDSCILGKDAALDLTAVHAILLSATRSPGHSAVDQAEEVKVNYYHTSCATVDVFIVPVGVDTFGGMGARGRAFLSALFLPYASYGSTSSTFPPGVLQRECWGRWSVALHRALGHQLGVLFPGGLRACSTGTTFTDF